MIHLALVALGVPLSLPDATCCRVAEIPQPTVARTIVLLPVVDLREGYGGTASVGLYRNQFGAPRMVKPPEPLTDGLADAITERLRERGHEVRIAEGWPVGADLELDADELRARFGHDVQIVAPTVTEWTVDVSATGTWRASADLDLRVVDAADRLDSVALRIERGEGGNGVAVELKERAWDWYGRDGARWAVSAAYSTALTDLADLAADTLDEGAGSAVASSD